MVKILPPYTPEVPDRIPGMKLSVKPSSHARFLWDYEYYDQLGRDPLQEYKVWGIKDDEERVEGLKEALQEFPKTKHRRNLLLKAASRGDEAIVRYLVETGLKVHPDIAKAQEQQKEIEEREKRGESPEEDEDGIIPIPDIDDPTVAPLHKAASCGHLDCVKIMIESGVEVDVRDEFGRTALWAAASTGHLEVVRYILGQGANPTARTDETELAKEYMPYLAGADVLEVAATQGNVDILRLLLDHPFYGSTRKRKNREDEEPGVWVTPRAIKHVASTSFQALKLLLERGAYPLEDKDGKSKGELLSEEEKSAIVDATIAALFGGDLESVHFLLSYQYPTDDTGKPLPFEVPDTLRAGFIRGAYHAMEVDSQAKFEYLYSFGIKEHDTMSLDGLPEGQTLNIQHLFDLAAEHGSINCVRLLIEKYGADPNAHRIPPGSKPLYMATAYGRTELVRYLLENHTMDIHLGSGRYATGPTPLWTGIHLKELDCVELFLKHGGPVDEIDDEIRNINGPISAILRTDQTAPPSIVHLETEANAKKYLDLKRGEYIHEQNPLYIRLELDADDKSWISKLVPRRSEEELREHGKNARELNKKEAAKLIDLDPDDPRRVLGEIPTVEGKHEKLCDHDDLMPGWKPAFVYVSKGDDE